jgi:hypothetical protein
MYCQHVGERGSISAWGTMLQAGRSWVQFLMRSLDFSSDFIQLHNGHGVNSASNRNEYQKSSKGKTDNLTTFCEPIV